MKIIKGKISALDRQAVLAYMGVAGKSFEFPEELYNECEKIALECFSPIACYEVYPLELRENDGVFTVDMSFAAVASRDLYKNLENCKKTALFAATVGIEIDRQIAKYSKIAPSKSVVLQAMGTAAAEQWTNEVNRIIIMENGMTSRRFSCGYGDCPLSLQREIFEALSVTKSIGITLTDGDLMMPSKSVTAMVGIKE